MAAHKPEISAIVVCFNEEDNIGRCLRSLSWCDEIVVVDAFSTDRTVSAEGIDHPDLVAPGEAPKTTANVVLFVEADDDRGNLGLVSRHGRYSILAKSTISLENSCEAAKNQTCATRCGNFAHRRLRAKSPC